MGYVLTQLLNSRFLRGNDKSVAGQCHKEVVAAQQFLQTLHLLHQMV